MTRLKNTFLGIPSGKMGDIIFKIRRGKPYMSSAPVEIKKTKSPKVLEARFRMGLTSSFSTILVKNTFIKTLWENSDIAAETSRLKAIKVNYPLLAFKKDVACAKLVPCDNLFNALVQGHEWGDNYLRITIAPLNNQYTEIYYPEISAHGVMHLYDPQDDQDKQNKFIPVSSESIPFRNNESFTFNINFTPDDNDVICGYNSKAVLINIMLTDKKRLPGACSKPLYFIH